MTTDMQFIVELSSFKGPIDLLLHLVKKNELDLEELSLAKICDQYLKCLEQMKNIDLDIAGEYLVIAATLLSVKSKLLLDEKVELEVDEDGNIIDPHQELLERLKEAAIYQKASKVLMQKDKLNLDVFKTPSKLSKFKDPDQEFKEHNVLLLGKAFARLINELEKQDSYYSVNLESVSIVDRMMHVLDVLKSSAGKKIKFTELVQDITSKGELIGSFLSLLELCKRHVIEVVQDEYQNQIMVELVLGQEEKIDISSEYDIQKNTVNG